MTALTSPRSTSLPSHETTLPVLDVNITKRVGSTTLKVAFCTPADAHTLALLGASGAGKSLTLACIAGLITPDTGSIKLGNRVLFDREQRISVPAQERHIGYVFQHYALFPHLTVERNIATGLARMSRADKRRRLDQLLEQFQLTDQARQLPNQLSGGQQQRVALARCLACDPELVLLDEPFSALDEHLRWQLELELSQTLARFGKPAVLVSHNRDEVMRLASHVCVIDHGVAQPVQEVAQFFAAPVTVSAAALSGCKNLAPAEVRGPHNLFVPSWGCTLSCASQLSDGVTWVGVRSHAIALAQDCSTSRENVSGEAASCADSLQGVRSYTGASQTNCLELTVERIVPSPFAHVILTRTCTGALLRAETHNELPPFVQVGAHIVGVIEASDVLALIDSQKECGHA